MKIAAAIAIVVGALCAHFYAMETGIYAAQLKEGLVWFDNLLHAGVGIAFALVWLSMWERLAPQAGKGSTLLTMLAFVAVVAGAWELFEYGFYLVFKSGALGLTVYEPSLREALFDSLSNIGGAALFAAAWLSAHIRAQKTTEE